MSDEQFVQALISTDLHRHSVTSVLLSFLNSPIIVVSVPNLISYFNSYAPNCTFLYEFLQTSMCAL